MNNAEAMQVVHEIQERMSLLKEYLACKIDFDTVRYQILEMADGQTKCGAIADAVAEEFNVPVETMRGPGRPEYLVVPRQLAMYLSYKTTNCKVSLSAIGKWYGGRDHGTVLHAIKATENRLWANTNGIRERYARIEKKLHPEKAK